jgi:glycosyltransferase involved in cell wall biosynthesis
MTQFSSWYSGLCASEREGIIVTGVVSPTEKRDILAAMDVLVLASRTESFGIVYLEAWANKKPVIAASVGAVPEIVRHNQNGLLVAFNDDREIANSIQKLLEDRCLAQRLGACGFRTTAANHTWDAVLDRVTLAHEKMLGHAMC